MESVLAGVSLLTGIGAGALLFVAASRQPEKAKQLRGLSGMFLGLAVLTALLLVL